jgi:hypothetical protein
MTATLLETGDARGKIEIVMNHQNMGQFNFIETGQRLHGLATKVHKCIGLEEPHFMAINIDPRDGTVEFLLLPESHIVRVRQGIQKPETGVMTRVLILWPGITQTDNKINTR